MRRLMSLCLAAAAAALGNASCGEGYQDRHDFVRTATVTLGRQTAFAVIAPLPVTVAGHPRSSDLVYRLEGTITASSATVARTLAEAVKVTVVDLEPNGIGLDFQGLPPRNATVEGRLTVTLPEDMDVQVIGQGGPVDVTGVEGAIDADGISHVRVLQAVGSVDAKSAQGNVIVQTSALPGSRVELGTNRGDVQLVLPATPSVDLRAQAGGGGSILVRHPRFPRHVGGDLPYAATVGGGLSGAILTTGAGNVVIDAQ